MAQDAASDIKGQIRTNCSFAFGTADTEIIILKGPLGAYEARVVRRQDGGGPGEVLLASGDAKSKLEALQLLEDKSAEALHARSGAKTGLGRSFGSLKARGSPSRSRPSRHGKVQVVEEESEEGEDSDEESVAGSESSAITISTTNFPSIADYEELSDGETLSGASDDERHVHVGPRLGCRGSTCIGQIPRITRTEPTRVPYMTTSATTSEEAVGRIWDCSQPSSSQGDPRVLEPASFVAPGVLSGLGGADHRPRLSPTYSGLGSPIRPAVSSTSDQRVSGTGLSPSTCRPVSMPPPPAEPSPAQQQQRRRQQQRQPQHQQALPPPGRGQLPPPLSNLSIQRGTPVAAASNVAPFPPPPPPPAQQILPATMAAMWDVFIRIRWPGHGTARIFNRCRASRVSLQQAALAYTLEHPEVFFTSRGSKPPLPGSTTELVRKRNWRAFLRPVLKTADLAGGAGGHRGGSSSSSVSESDDSDDSDGPYDLSCYAGDDLTSLFRVASAAGGRVPLFEVVLQWHMPPPAPAQARPVPPQAAAAAAAVRPHPPPPPPPPQVSHYGYAPR